MAALKDARTRVNLGPKALPSCLTYTLFNATTFVNLSRVLPPPHSSSPHTPCSITCMAFSDDCSLLATGGSDSAVRVWSLTDADLMALQPGDQIAKRNVTRMSHHLNFRSSPNFSFTPHQRKRG